MPAVRSYSETPVVAWAGAGDPQNSFALPNSFNWDAAQNANLTHNYALGGEPVRYIASKATANANPNGFTKAFGTAGDMVAGQDAVTAGLLATAGKDAIPAIKGVDRVLGSTGIGLGLDIAANSAQARSEILAGRDPHQAISEAAGRVIAGNAISEGAGWIVGSLVGLATLNPAIGAAAGIATGAVARYGADKYGITDAAGRRLAPLF